MEDPASTQVSTQIPIDLGGNAIAAPFDVANWAAVDEAISSIVSRFGALDGLVNNAAIYKMAGILECTPELWDETIHSNLIGVAAHGQRAAQQMIEQGSGSIVNITSGAQCGTGCTMSAYGATKAAVAALTYTWALELEELRVRVNAVSPRGATRMAEYGAAFIRRRTSVTLPPEPHPARNAPAVCFLLSDHSLGVTGQVVRVDGNGSGLMTHPAVSVPVAEQPKWDVESVAELFERDLRQRMFPPGVIGLAGAALASPQDERLGHAVEWRSADVMTM